MKPCLVVPLGRMAYASAWELQRRLHARVVAGALPDLLLLLEHPHVYTLGKRGALSDVVAGPETLAALGVDVVHTDRGGEATYHGPGQLVGYPIVNLRAWGGGALRYVRALESAIASMLGEFGIPGGSGDRPTGVWVGDAKIAAIGVKISRGVTMHGFALNVTPDLAYFDHIVPCGMPGGRVTSMASELREDVGVEQVSPLLARHFGQMFERAMEWTTAEQLGEEVGALGLATA